MIVTLKTLQQKSFKIEIDEGETVGVTSLTLNFTGHMFCVQKVLALKERIEKEQGDSFLVAGQKLIYAGER